jgi:ribosome maturation factor RimP
MAMMNTETSKQVGSATNRRPKPGGDSNVRTKEAVISKIRALAEPLCESEGMELVHVEFQRERSGRILRLYIDKRNGVSLEDCACISRQMSDLLDVSLDIETAYHLEVSSPGSNRPLSMRKDYDRFIDQTVKLKIKQPIGNQRNFTGILCGTAKTGESVILETEKGKIYIPFHDIIKANLVNYNGA